MANWRCTGAPLMLLTSLVLALGLQAAPTGGLDRSEVVFMYGADEATYRSYGASFRSWGDRARNDSAAALAEFAGWSLTPARANGMRYATGLAFRTAFAEMIDYDPNFLDAITRDLDGEPILVPWLWDHEHKGHGAYWFCTNAPGYQRYLRWQARRAAVRDADGVMVEGLHIDDYAGTSGCPGGCFCRYCMEGFAAWLAQHGSAADLERVGRDDWAGFDYAAWLQAEGVTAETARERRWTVPLDRAYQTYQVQAARDWVAEIKRYSEELRGAPVLLSVNSSASSADSLVITPYLDFFCGEVDHHASADKVPDTPVFVAKLTDALGRGSAWTGSGWDWAYVKANNRPGLVRTWVAQGYALGYSLMAPNRQWCYTPELGTHWYSAEPGDYDWLYRWVRAHRDLFDGYDPYPGGTLAVYSNPAFRNWRRELIDTVGWLTAQSQPFALALAGDDWLPDRLDPAALAAARAIVLREPGSLDAEQRALLEAQGERLIVISAEPDEAELTAAAGRLAQLDPPAAVVEGAPGVVAMPRVRDDGAVGIPLLNRNYDPTIDGVREAPAVRLRLRGDLAAARATVWAPEAEPREVAAAADGSLEVGPLGLWAIVALSR